MAQFAAHHILYLSHCGRLLPTRGLSRSYYEYSVPALGD